MKCAYCGREVELDDSYCPKCGKEIQLVAEPAFEEDDMLRSLLEDQADSAVLEKCEQAHARDISALDAEKIEARQEELNHQFAKVRNKREQQKQQNKEQERNRAVKKSSRREKVLNISLGVISVAVLVGIGLAVKMRTDYVHANSFEYQYEQAKSMQEQGNRAAALTYYENALALEPKNVDVRLQLVNLYRKKNMNDEAIDMLKTVLTLDKTNEEAYRNLLEIYVSQEDYDSVRALQSMAENENDDKLLALFADYNVEQPIFLLGEGTYNKEIKVDIDANINDTILYTTDGSDPRENGQRYDTPIVLDEEGSYIISAIAVDKYGFVSDTAVAYYKIDYDAPTHVDTSKTDDEDGLRYRNNGNE